MASASLLLPFGSSFSKRLSGSHQTVQKISIEGFMIQCSSSESRLQPSKTIDHMKEWNFVKRRDVIGLGFGLSGLLLGSPSSKAAGLPPEQKPRLCDDDCEKEIENAPMVTTESGLQYKEIKVGRGPSPPVGFQVAANYVAMVPSGQIFDSSLEKGQLYIFRVGAGQVIKGLDEGVLSMKVGGKRRLYIPGPIDHVPGMANIEVNTMAQLSSMLWFSNQLAFPKGLTSAPGRPRVAAYSPVIFDVSLEYIPGLEDDEE